MASEDIFADYSEEIITELDKEVTNGTDQDIIEEETEDFNDIIDTAIATEEEVNTEVTPNEAAPTEAEIAPLPLQTATTERESKLFQLPLTRVRNLMKLDPDLHIASNEAVFIVTRATELFIESLARESYTYTAQAKKKTVQKRDVDLAITAVDSLMFLEGAMNF